MRSYRLFKFASLQNKRLLTKLSFVLTLIIIPVSVFGITMFLNQDSGVFRVALYAQKSDDSTGEKIIKRLTDSTSTISFKICENEADAESMVLNGKCDEAWIIKADAKRLIEEYCSSKLYHDPFLKIIQRDSSVTSNLSHEKLYGAVFPDVVYGTFVSFIQEELPELKLSTEEIRKIYKSSEVSGEIVSYKYLQSGGGNVEAGVLSSPIRGILSVIVILCGLAAQMVFLHDSKEGVFDWIPKRKRILIGTGITFVAICDALVAVFASMLISGNTVSITSEIVCALVYIPVATAFCVLIGTLFGSQRALGIFIPFLMLLLLLLSPIFLSLYFLENVHMLFPPYYYLNSFYGENNILYALIYSAVLFLLSGVINLIKCKGE